MTEHFDFKNYIGPVGKKELRQFERAAKNPLTSFEREIADHLYDGATYYPISDRKNVPGRNHHRALAVAEGREKLNVQAFFANRLQVAEPINEPGMRRSMRLCSGCRWNKWMFAIWH